MKTNIKSIREEKGLSQRKVAEDLDIPLRTYIRYENGETENLQIFIRIAEYFDVDINKLVALRKEPCNE